MHRQNIMMIGGVVVVAAFAGLAIAGLPEPVPSGDSIIAAASSTSSTGAPAEPAPTTASTLLARNPAQVRVLVANGSGIEGAAADLTGQFEDAGYRTLTPATSSDTAETIVYFREGFEGDANAVSALISISPGPPRLEVLPDPPPVPAARDADVLVLLGADFDPGDVG